MKYPPLYGGIFIVKSGKGFSIGQNTAEGGAFFESVQKSFAFFAAVVYNDESNE